MRQATWPSASATRRVGGCGKSASDRRRSRAARSTAALGSATAGPGAEQIGTHPQIELLRVRAYTCKGRPAKRGFSAVRPTRRTVMTRYVAHLDADCFYVSAERVRHPDLVGKPVGVLGNNGACVIAKSYEMKARGVKPAVPLWAATALCTEGGSVKRCFYWYAVRPGKILAAVGTFSPRVEYSAIDEFFLEAPPPARRDDLQATVTAIRDHIKESASL